METVPYLSHSTPHQPSSLSSDVMQNTIHFGLHTPGQNHYHYHHGNHNQHSHQQTATASFWYQDRPTVIANDVSSDVTHKDAATVNEIISNTKKEISDECQNDEKKDMAVNDDEDKDATESPSTPHKQSQIGTTLKWLSENYERAEGVCLPRCVLYTHYLDFCKKKSFSPAGAATFGKIIRQRFPKLTTRRLGTRGQSKYHYYGIGIKETSIYYHSVYSGKGLTRFSGTKVKTEGSNRKYSLSSKTGTLLPEFPDSNNFILPENLAHEKMQTFIIMYRTHCQRILDTVISANFDEVQNFILHFWQGMPDHLVDILEADLIADLVALCDSILYKVLIDVLVPSTIQDLPDSLCTEIRIFSKRLPMWLENCLEGIPKKIKSKKLEVALHFIKSLRRQICFVHLAQTARAVLMNHDSVAQMTEDASHVDLGYICQQASFSDPRGYQKHGTNVRRFFEEFQNLLNKQAPVEAYTEWLDNVVDICVLKPCKNSRTRIDIRAAEFMLHWTLVSSLLMRDLTLHSAVSFGSFHLIHLMFDEYLFLVMETQQAESREHDLQLAVQRFMKHAGEINMQSKLRTPTNKLQASPKNRKRKLDDSFGSDEETETPAAIPENSDVRTGADDAAVTYPGVNGTAFTRPVPTALRDHGSDSFQPHYPEDTPPSRIPFVQSSPVPISPLKHFSSINGATYDRPSYLPSFGIGSYTDYMPTNPPTFAPGPRVQNYTDSHGHGHAHASSLATVPFSSSIASSAGSYWTDTRPHHPTFSDHYSPYSYKKLNSAYDTYNQASFLRTPTYHQDSLNRSAFEPSMAYYGRSHENLQVGAQLSMNTYGGNFMDIAPSGGQYARQDGFFYQDDIYTGSVPGLPSFGKTYITTPFR